MKKPFIVLVNDMLYTARNGCYPALVVGDGVLTLRPMFNIILTHTISLDLACLVLVTRERLLALRKPFNVFKHDGFWGELNKQPCSRNQDQKDTNKQILTLANWKKVRNQVKGQNKIRDRKCESE